MDSRKDRIWAKNVAPKMGDTRFVQMLSSAQEELFLYIMSLAGGDLETSKDCLQEANVRIWQRQEQFDPRKGSFIGWAKAIAFAQVRTARLRMLRANKRFVWDEDALERIAQLPAPPCDNRLAALHHCLKKLPGKSRSLLRRHYLDGVKIADIAEREKTSEVAMYKTFSRFRKSLSDCMLNRICEIQNGFGEAEEPDELRTAIEELFAKGAEAESALAVVRGNVASPALQEALFVHALLHWDAEQERNRRTEKAARRLAQLPRIAAALFLCGCGAAFALSKFSGKLPPPPATSLAIEEGKTAPTERTDYMKTNAALATLALAAVTTAAEGTTLGTYTGTVPATRTKLFSGVSLADVKSVSGLMGGSLANSGIWAKCTPWHFTNDGSTLSVQFQVYLGDYTKCVILTLDQDGDDIYGFATARYYNSKWNDSEGIDFSKVSNSGGYTLSQVELSTEATDELNTELWWNGVDGATWNTENANWLDSDGNATTWLSGARANFTNDNAQTIVVGEGIAASHLDIGGDKITFTGDTLEMTGAGEVVLRKHQGVRFENSITGDSGLRLTAQNLWSTPSALTKSWQVLFANTKLQGVTQLTAVTQGVWSGADRTDARSYHVVNDGQTLTAQMQFYGGPRGGNKNFKCIFIELRQNGADIEGRITDVKYWIPVNQAPWGMDFSANDRNINSGTIAETASAEGYGLGTIDLQTSVELAAANTYTRETRIDRAVTLRLDGGTLGGGTYDYQVVNYYKNSEFDIRHTRQTFTKQWGSVSYDGKVLIKGTVTPGESELVYRPLLPQNNTDVVTIFRNANVADWIGVDAWFNGLSMDDKSETPAVPCFFRNDGNRATVLFQRYDNNKYTKCACYEFRQNGTDIVCQRIGTCYVGNTKSLGTEWYSYATGNYGYSVSNLIVKVKDPTDTSVTFTAANSTYKGGLTIDGAAVFAKAQNSIPNVAGSVCVVTNHAKLFFDPGSTLNVNEGTSNMTDFEFSDGSFARWCHNMTTGLNKSLAAKSNSILEAEHDSYVTHLTLENSTLRWTDHADAIKRYLRAGFETNGVLSQAYVKVRGVGESRIEAPIALVAAPNEPETEWLLDIADTNGDADWDLIVSAEISDFTESNGKYSGRPVRKTGSGTLALTHSNSFTGQVSVAEGTLALAADNALNTNNVIIETATIDATGHSNTLGTLNAKEYGTLLLDGNSRLSFKDSSAIAWEGGIEIEVDGLLVAGMLRFGTDANGLTSEQLRRISCNGRGVRLDANGYAIPPPTGTVIMLLN